MNPTPSNTTLPVHEVFDTFQGEGVHMGRHAFFIRLFGCPVKCPWCDSAGTWHIDYLPKHINRLAVNDLVRIVQDSHAPIVVVTGGEPTIHNLEALTGGLRANGINSHLETSGAFEIRGTFDWVTLSPKRWAPPLVSCIAKAHEFKIIVEQASDIQFYLDMLLKSGGIVPSPDRRPPSIWLHPEWSKRNDKAVLAAICEAVKQDRSGWIRAGWQLHKFYRVDALDARSQPLVPLGGDPARGY